MLYEITLLILTLSIIFISLILLERRADLRFLNRYGADIKEFDYLIRCVKNLEFDKVPKPIKDNDSVYNELLKITHSYLTAYVALDTSKQELIALSNKNRELINAYVKVLHLLSPNSFATVEEENRDETKIKEMLSEINTSIENLSKLS